MWKTRKLPPQNGSTGPAAKMGRSPLHAAFCDDDYAAYIEWMADHCRDEGVATWACCLMPNHHLIAVPETKQGLWRATGEAHRRDTRRINFRENRRGYFCQGRFASFIMADHRSRGACGPAGGLG